MTFVAYRLVRPYTRYSSIVYYTGIAISLRPVITSLVLSIQGRSCAHAIYSLSCVVDYYVNCGSMINICALDLSKAFDKMSHYGLFIKLMERWIPDMLLYVIEHWFSIGRICVKWGTYFSRYFNLSCGVRQGGVLSPCLFAMTVSLRRLRPHALTVM